MLDASICARRVAMQWYRPKFQSRVRRTLLDGISSQNERLRGRHTVLSRVSFRRLKDRMVDSDDLAHSTRILTMDLTD